MIDTAERDAQAGMNAATDHANRVTYLWEVAAIAYLKFYIASVAKDRHDFMTEDVRIAAEATHAIEDPPDKRAWGRPIRKLLKLGIIRHATDEHGRELYAASKTGRKRPMHLWRWTGAPLT